MSHVDVVVASAGAVLFSLTYADFEVALKGVLGLSQQDRLVYLRMHPLFVDVSLEQIDEVRVRVWSCGYGTHKGFTSGYDLFVAPTIPTHCVGCIHSCMTPVNYYVQAPARNLQAKTHHLKSTAHHLLSTAHH